MDHEHSTVDEVIDPVCGMSIVAEDAAGSVEYGGTTYYFCNPSCVEKFQANPEQFVGPALHHDPVCGMDIAVEDAAGSVDYDRTTYYFCNPSCLEKFKNNPKRYLDPQPLPTAGNTAVEYTCPMDPEVHQMGPGACPKCGMALEPATVAAPQIRTEYTCPMHPEIVRAGARFLPHLWHGSRAARRYR